ncbi:TrmH family RNA methyltransferase [Flindersiella endophytica]
MRALLDVRRGAYLAGFVLVEGLWAHECLLARNAGVVTFVWCPQTAGSERIVRCAAALAARAVEAYQVSARVLDRLTSRVRTDGLVSLVRLPRRPPAGFPAGAGSVVLVADGVQYAANLGALLRTVDASGAVGLVLTNRQARLEHPVTFTASRGAVLTTPVVDFPAVDAAADWLDAHRFACCLADPAAPVAYHSYVRDGRPAALVVGSEGHGLSPTWLGRGYHSVSIPMRGTVDSLNVAVAAGVLLFELVRQTTQREAPHALRPV